MKKVTVYYAKWADQTIISYRTNRNGPLQVVRGDYNHQGIAFYEEMFSQKLLDASFEVRVISNKICYFTFRCLKKTPSKVKELVKTEVTSRYPNVLAPVVHYRISPLNNGQFLIEVWVINQDLVDQVKELFINFKKNNLSIIPNQPSKPPSNTGGFIKVKISLSALEVAIFDKGALLDYYVLPQGFYQLEKTLSDQKITSTDEQKTLNRWWLKPEEAFIDVIDHQKLTTYRKVVSEFMQKAIFKINLIVSCHNDLIEGQITVDHGIFNEVVKSYQEYVDLKRVAIC